MLPLQTHHIKDVERELKSLPPGRLVRRRTFYCHAVGDKESGITRNKNLIQELARKAYLTQLLKILKQNEKHLAKCVPVSPEAIIGSLSAAYQSLPPEYFFIATDDAWANAPYEKNPAYPENLIYRTNSGLMVRSKSERDIANALDAHHIPYRYEAAISINGQTKYPDFTIKIGGRIFLWEHLGRMDRPSYRQQAAEKLKLYGEIGYFPYNNLICTYEDDLHDTAQIHLLINMFLLNQKKWYII